MDQSRRWKWGYFEPKFFRVQGGRIVNVASTEQFDISLQFAEAFAADGTIYRNVWLVTCRVQRDICDRVYDVARAYVAAAQISTTLHVIKALTLIKL
jgi:hypothetical protein